jgi:type 1 fimbriae regulatory protein FimE
MTPKSFHTLISRLGERAGMAFPIHPHMLRHACGYALANAGHDTRAIQAWMGHRNFQHTVSYTELAVDRFRDFWQSRGPTIQRGIPANDPVGRGSVPWRPSQRLQL